MAYLTYISSDNSNALYCIDTSLLTDYILDSSEQQFFENIYAEVTTIISDALLSASVLAGSNLYTQSQLNRIYLRKNENGFSEDDAKKLIDYMNTRMVGNDIVDFPELKDTIK